MLTFEKSKNGQLTSLYCLLSLGALFMGNVISWEVFPTDLWGIVLVLIVASSVIFLACLLQDYFKKRKELNDCHDLLSFVAEEGLVGQIIIHYNRNYAQETQYIIEEMSKNKRASCENTSKLQSLSRNRDQFKGLVMRLFDNPNQEGLDNYSMESLQSEA